MKKLQEYIERPASTITGKKNLEALYTFHDFPVFMGCTDQPIENDILADMNWAIDPETGLIQLTKLVPMEILYMDQHMDATGATWAAYNSALAKFIVDNKIGNILEIGGGSGKLAYNILELDNTLTYTVVEPNPTFEEIERLKIIHAFFSKGMELEESIKTIVLSQVLEHVYDPISFLTEVNESLPIGGRFVFGYPNLEFLFSNYYTNAINLEHTMLMTEYFVDYFLERTGFKILSKIDYDNHSHFYSVEKNHIPLNDENLKIESRYEHYKEMFNGYISYHKGMVQILNREILETTSDVFLFGAHIFSQYLFSFGLDTSNIKYILDNSPMKQEKRLYGSTLMVKSPKVLAGIDKPLIILKAGLYNEEIKKDILENINSTAIFI
jgi:SAM-dependent methyltransferase